MIEVKNKFKGIGVIKMRNYKYALWQLRNNQWSIIEYLEHKNRCTCATCEIILPIGEHP